MNCISKDYIGCSRLAAAEGMVLLKNDGNILPIKAEDNVAVFGRCQIDYYKSGTGSGGSVHVPYSVNAIEGFKKCEFINLNEELAWKYGKFVEENPFDNGGGGWAAEPWHQEEMVLGDELLSSIRETSNKALVIIGRTAGEEQDNHDTEGSYRLTELEMDMLIKVCSHFDQVVIVLNVSNIIDMSFTNDERIVSSLKGILYAWHGGVEGGNALADIISGKVNPCGKLTDTISYQISDYPSHSSFDGDVMNCYEEDIYVGYRYFETFNHQAVQYPFGYGLSYSDFTIEVKEAKIKGEHILVKVGVTNTSDQYFGKEVIQVYYEAPQGLLGKPKLQLTAFAKTQLLKPKEEELLQITIPISSLASYDDSGISGKVNAYVLEAGEYKLYVGNSSKNLIECTIGENNGGYMVESLVVVEQLSQALSPVISFNRIKPGLLNADGNYEKVYEEVPTKKSSIKNRIISNLPNTIRYTGNKGILLSDVKEGKYSLESFIAQLSSDELQTIVRGEGMGSLKVTYGTAAAFGGVGSKLLQKGIPTACCADGPSGIRMDTGETAFQVPIGTALACSWNVELIKDLYTYMGNELQDHKIDVLLGPGMNIHRHPLNGRNFEYFSEDPYVSGTIASAITSGLKQGGAVGAIKHFAANDQERGRSVVDSVVSERALREIHLKGFEMAVKDGEATSVMTAYNPINGIWAASNYDLNTTILRNEWGFKGIVMTDWWAKMNDPVEGGQATINNTAAMVRSQNDIYMVVNNDGAEVNGYKDNLAKAIESGHLTEAELQRSAINICEFILNSSAMKRPIKTEGIKAIVSATNKDNVAAISLNEEVEVGFTKDSSLWVKVDKDGIYRLSATMRYDAFNSAQSACNLLMNNVFVTTINLNGTGGNSVSKKVADVQLYEGDYLLKLDFVKPGIEIIGIKLIEVE